METNIEEGVVWIGGLLFLIIALLVISAVTAAWHSGWLDGFFKGLAGGLSCISVAKGNPLEVINCIAAIARAILGSIL